MDEQVIQAHIENVRQALPRIFSIQGVPQPTPEEIASANQRLQMLMDVAPISRFDPVERAEKILGSGRFKSVLEREEERALQGRAEVLGPDYARLRRDTEREFFGIPTDNIGKRPIYAVTSNNAWGDVRKYGGGEVQFIFRDSVRSMGTVTLGDSLNRLASGGEPLNAQYNLLAAAPLDQVGIELLGTALVLTRLQHILDCATLDELVSLLGTDYFEVQLHGDVSVFDVERIQLKRGIILSKQAQEWAEQHSIIIQRPKPR